MRSERIGSISLVLATFATACGARPPCEPCSDARGEARAASEPTSPAVLEDAPLPEPEPAPRVVVGTCDVGWLPAGVVVDTAPADTERLADAVRTWVGVDAIRELRIEGTRGIAYAKSEDDLGADPPYPTRTRAQSRLACGLESEWLADHVRATLARQASPDFGGVTCDDNVCCFAGMEYMSSGVLVARLVALEGSTSWVLDAYVEVADAAIAPHAIAANRSYVAAALARERTRACPGEPAALR